MENEQKEMIGIRVSKQTREQLEKIAKRERRTLSQLIRIMIEDDLKIKLEEEEQQGG